MAKHEIVIPENHLPAWIYLHQQNPNTYIEPHWHSSIEISYTMKGHIANFMIDGQSYTTSPGTVLVVNTMEVHSIKTFYNPDIDQMALTLIFPYDIVKHYKPDLENYYFQINNPEQFTNSQKQAYTYLTKKLDDLVAIYEHQDNLEKTILLLEILRVLLTHFLVEQSISYQSINQDNKNKERIQDIKYYIDANFKADISLEDIATASYLSKEYLARFFKDTIGITVFQYVNYIRAKHAYDLLLNTNDTATKIALDSGFSGLRTMDRALLKVYGKSSRELKVTRQ